MLACRLGSAAHHLEGDCFTYCLSELLDHFRASTREVSVVPCDHLAELIRAHKDYLDVYPLRKDTAWLAMTVVRCGWRFCETVPIRPAWMSYYVFQRDPNFGSASMSRQQPAPPVFPVAQECNLLKPVSYAMPSPYFGLCNY